MSQYHIQVLNKNGTSVVEDFGFVEENEVEDTVDDVNDQYPGHPVRIEEVQL